MENIKIHNKGTRQLFSNRLLERLTRTPFYIPVSLYYAVGTATIVYAGITPAFPLAKTWWMFPAGMFLFTLVEYFIHRYLFHFEPKSDAEAQIAYHIHGVHHEYPRDKDRLVMPPVMSLLISGIFLSVFLWLFKTPGWLFYGGFMAGYSNYLMVHYAVHAWRPPSNFLRVLWQHHALHHYSSPERAFAVSFPFWDRLFGTMPEPRKSPAATSETA